MADAAAQILNLDVVHLIPASRQPFKPPAFAPAHARLAMLELATQSSPVLTVDDRELKRGGTSYMVDTLEELRETFPGDELTLLVGADAATELPTWRAAERLPGLASIVVLSRPRAEVPHHALIAGRVDVPAVDVSATAIRDRVRRGQPLAGLVPAAVEAYIEEHGLYRLEKD